MLHIDPFRLQISNGGFIPDFGSAHQPSMIREFTFNALFCLSSFNLCIFKDSNGISNVSPFCKPMYTSQFTLFGQLFHKTLPPWDIADQHNKWWRELNATYQGLWKSLSGISDVLYKKNIGWYLSFIDINHMFCISYSFFTCKMVLCAIECWYDNL